MFYKTFKLFLILFLFYQTPVNSKSTSSKNFDRKDLSNYFSGIIALENNNNSNALNFFNSSKDLLKEHDPFIQKYVTSLVLENKIQKAINLIKENILKDKSKYFDAYLLLIIDSLNRNNLDDAESFLVEASANINGDKFKNVILESLKDYTHVFKNKVIKKNSKNFGNLSLINQTFQRCYLNDSKTGNFFSNLINNNEADYSRYTFFYINYLLDNGRIKETQNIAKEIKYINSSLLLSQTKNWIENNNEQRIKKVFSCKDQKHIISEFLFLISNLYSSQDNFEKSNFYLNLSLFLNPKFIYNLSLVSENYYSIKDYKKTKKILSNFEEKDILYYWYRIKKKAQIISKQKNVNASLRFIETKFEKLEKTNEKILFDLANYYRSKKKYEKAIPLYSELINRFNKKDKTQSNLLYRRGSSFERIGSYEEADMDLQSSLEIDPDDAYVLNYLAYSWLERNYKIDKAIEMLEIAYSLESDDPYIIDSIGWAYFLIKDYIKAEKFLIRAVQLMPDDPIVNDHYGDVLWKLDRKIQARYFWSNVLLMDEVEKEIIEKINLKISNGLKDS